MADVSDMSESDETEGVVVVCATSSPSVQGQGSVAHRQAASHSHTRTHARLSLFLCRTHPSLGRAVGRKVVHDAEEGTEA